MSKNEKNNASFIIEQRFLRNIIPSHNFPKSLSSSKSAPIPLVEWPLYEYIILNKNMVQCTLEFNHWKFVSAEEIYKAVRLYTLKYTLITPSGKKISRHFDDKTKYRDYTNALNIDDVENMINALRRIKKLAKASDLDGSGYILGEGLLDVLGDSWSSNKIMSDDAQFDELLQAAKDEMNTMREENGGFLDFEID